METALARAALYNFLATVFGDSPTPDMMRATAEMLPEAESASLEELQCAYTRLLIGPGVGYAPPYASIYLDQSARIKPLLWGQESVAVESLYREAGLEIAPGQPRVPDHLALEFQFMQHLCACEAHAELQGDAAEAAGWRDRQMNFLRDHLITWLPRFAARVTGDLNAHSFYCALTNFALTFVESEMNLSEELLTSRS